MSIFITIASILNAVMLGIFIGSFESTNQHEGWPGDPDESPLLYDDRPDLFLDDVNAEAEWMQRIDALWNPKNALTIWILLNIGLAVGYAIIF
jgi:hypothetical protein